GRRARVPAAGVEERDLADAAVLVEDRERGGARAVALELHLGRLGVAGAGVQDRDAADLRLGVPEPRVPVLARVALGPRRDVEVADRLRHVDLGPLVVALLLDIAQRDLRHREALADEGGGVDLEAEYPVARPERADVPPPLGRGV